MQKPWTYGACYHKTGPPLLKKDFYTFSYIHLRSADRRHTKRTLSGQRDSLCCKKGPKSKQQKDRNVYPVNRAALIPLKSTLMSQ